VGAPAYRLTLSRLAYFFRGSVSMEYLERAPTRRIDELLKHNNAIIEDLNRNG